MIEIKYENFNIDIYLGYILFGIFFYSMCIIVCNFFFDGICN